MPELLWSAIACTGLHVDTLDRLPTTSLAQDNVTLSQFGCYFNQEKSDHFSPVLPHRSLTDIQDLVLSHWHLISKQIA